MSMIDISNVINISVQVPPAGLAPYSVNNLVCFTKDVPLVTITDGYSVYSSASEVATDWGTESLTYKAAQSVFAQSPNIITGGGLFIVVKLVTAETLQAAMIRAATLVYYGGCSYAFTADSDELLAAATEAQTLKKLLFITSSTQTDLLSPDGLFYKIKDQSLNHARCLFHSASAQLNAFRWGYAGRAMSVNFSASNTTMTMHLKTLAGVSSDTGLSQTWLLQADAVGADVYANIAGRASVLSYGANGFFDDVYNLDWIVGALQIGGFNYLAQTSTKIPQTEAGMDGLKGAYRRVCAQSVTNGFVAAGDWNSADTFGNPEDFKRNISDFGYYIYSAKVATQPVADRNDRKAPVCQIAIKYAGAIHSSDVIVYINQ